MEPIVWRDIMPPRKLLQGKSPEGRWSISPPRSGTCEIKFTRAHPPGHNIMSVMDLMDGLDTDDPEWWVLASYNHDRVLGIACTTEHAVALVDRVRIGSEGLPQVEDILAESCTFKYEFKNGDTVHRNYGLPIGKKGGLSITVTDDCLTARYDPAKSRFSHPVLRLEGDRMSFDNKIKIPAFWPEACRDHRAIAAKFAIDVLAPWIENNDMRILHKSAD